MTTLQAKQVAAHLALTSAYYWIAGRDRAAGAILLDARHKLSIDMDGLILCDAMELSTVVDYFGRAA
jgi:hypothetical protein